MSGERYFHFNIGPVQGFFAQARKTRDFWAGSFILSWLLSVAMQEVKKQNGEINFPKADKNFLTWLEGKQQKNDSKPSQGSIPNRFKAEVSGTFDPETVEKAVRFAWEALAEVVYKNDLQGIATDETKKIWNRQIEKFWEISWVITADKSDSAALDRRKNWRTWLPPDEPGVKCSIMEGWQELSGAETQYRKDMDDFWVKVRTKDPTLHESERLCSIAWVKRRFAIYFDKLDVIMPSGWRLTGWKISSTVPSVVYIAAVHWLEDVLKKAQKDEEVKKCLWAFHDAAHELTQSYGEWDAQIRCIKELDVSKKWKVFDGDVFFEDALKNKNNFSDEKKAAKVFDALKALRKACNQSPSSPFYAVLMMDGDSLGKHMSDIDKQEAVSKGLQEFTQEVPPIVYKHNGFLVYAGGDDVLALLPLEDALPCATELCEKYRDSFQGTGIPATISGAIEYVHMHVPLTKVLRDAHELLDQVAKDGCGRDAIAVRVWNPGGKALEWAQPWEIALDEKKKEVIIGRLANDFAKKDEKNTSFSSSFLYKIRTYFDLLHPRDDKDKEKSSDALISEEQAVDLMAAEYVASARSTDENNQSKKERMDEAKKIVKPLLEQCRRVTRDAEKPKEKWEKSKYLEADGALLVRFLARKGVDR